MTDPVTVTQADFLLVHDILTRHTHSDFSAVEAVAAHRQAGVQKGLDMAAGVAELHDIQGVIAAAIRKLGGDDGTD